MWSANNFSKQFGTQIRPDSIRPDLVPNCSTLIEFVKEIFENVNLKKVSRCMKAACKELTLWLLVGGKGAGYEK